ncbi:MAG: hypothetical protein ACOY93_18960 [Bacillota bacterium]
MEWIYVLAALGGMLALFFFGVRLVGGGRRVPTAAERDPDGRGGRDLGGNINPGQEGNRVGLWPLRTGARTRRELGARQAEDRTFTGERPERSGTPDLAPEDALGEDRPANRTVPPDQPPTQPHPREHGVPGDHIRGGHHRSATAPERKTGATDPHAHAPVPGPNHIPPEDGVDFPRNIQP